MLTIPSASLEKCSRPGTVEKLPYGEKFLLLYTPAAPASIILYVIHGGGGDQYAYFCPAFLNMVDHMIADGKLAPLYIVSPCFYDPKETDKTPGSSGRAVKKFIDELRAQVIPTAETRIGKAFQREDRAITGFSMGGVTTWYAFMQALDLFYWFLPMSGDCWICGEKGGGDHPEETAEKLAEAVADQGSPDFRIHAVTGSKDIAYPNLDPQIQAMLRREKDFGGKLSYDVLEDGVHNYECIFRYLYNYLPELFK